MVANKLFLNLMQKNRFVGECLSSVNHVAANCAFSESFSEKKD